MRCPRHEDAVPTLIRTLEIWGDLRELRVLGLLRFFFVFGMVLLLFVHRKSTIIIHYKQKKTSALSNYNKINFFECLFLEFAKIKGSIMIKKAKYLLICQFTLSSIRE